MRALLCLCCLLAAPALAGVGPVPAEGRIEVLFAPHDPVEDRLVALIAAARRSVHVQMYVFTRKRLAQALVDARARGVQVEVLADAKMNQRGQGALPLLLSAGVSVALETGYRASHNKVMLIDVSTRNNVVVTGSYNFSWSAGARNAENVMIVHGNRAVADAYFANWQRHRRDATPVRHLPVHLVD